MGGHLCFPNTCLVQVSVFMYMCISSMLSLKECSLFCQVVQFITEEMGPDDKVLIFVGRKVT